ncbi:hypothetical protein WH47_02292 [Habropoda laboriosa]|uniref:Uncharacterized protein n=1 Tax=Habropoda laboriosa TaxID=597456 RepID=A0A0L7QYU4_9HYME|nr:hypothetical protein WH47_02292 [Habropoda laboriosa]
MPVNSIDNLEERIKQTCGNVQNNILIGAAHRNLLERAELCVVEGGIQFENLL